MSTSNILSQCVGSYMSHIWPYALRSEKTVIAVDRIKMVLTYTCSHIDISFQEISEKSVEYDPRDRIT